MSTNDPHWDTDGDTRKPADHERSQRAAIRTSPWRIGAFGVLGRSVHRASNHRYTAEGRKDDASHHDARAQPLHLDGRRWGEGRSVRRNIPWAAGSNRRGEGRSTCRAAGNNLAEGEDSTRRGAPCPEGVVDNRSRRVAPALGREPQMVP